MTRPFTPEPYAPRRTVRMETRDARGWRVKRYAIVFGEGTLDAARFEAAWPLAIAELPEPARTSERPGVAFAIAHQGRGADYFVIAWWDRENELPLRVFVRDGDRWRAARGSESVCVWDVAIVAAERDAYVATVLAPRSAPRSAPEDVERAIERYLAVSAVAQ